jgi:alpha-amylase/alpha-mannosidase (GH57 family)
VADPLYVSFLWRMHQPFYKDPVQGEHILPGPTCLRSRIIITNMPAFVEANAGGELVFNLVPSL